MKQPVFVAEPPATYRLRPPLVVDCSLLAAVLFDEPERDDATTRMSGCELFAPHLLDFEIASVALKKSRLGLAEVAACGLADYGALPIRHRAIDLQGQVALALRYDLSTYDAAYLWLAAELKAPLATLDRRLGEAAQRHLQSLE
ncbi:MAG: type II toxin-antitoxin system VapC family toxin [Rhodocyclaceae bacterium]|jgi:predicted nucleic acid-binding protein|nr:type II toxin-antitoxin system VapC family toxin [Rhodocyclaceae bacterium]MCO5096470.1 type II toxin-antitoxin system VapC family toxin [Rhodocyclaceae bacterium]